MIFHGGDIIQLNFLNVASNSLANLVLLPSALKRGRHCCALRTTLSLLVFTTFHFWTWSRENVMSCNVWHFPVGAFWPYLVALHKGLWYLGYEQPQQVLLVLPHAKIPSNHFEIFFKYTWTYQTDWQHLTWYKTLQVNFLMAKVNAHFSRASPSHWHLVYMPDCWICAGPTRAHRTRDTVSHLGGSHFGLLSVLWPVIFSPSSHPLKPSHCHIKAVNFILTVSGSQRGSCH